MAFCDLEPVRVLDEDSGSTYYIGDVFALYSFGANFPVVYSWDMLKSVSVTRKNIVFETKKKKYSFSAERLVGDSYFRAVAIIEWASRIYNFSYEHEKRLFPLKSLYADVIPGKEAYIGEGEIDEVDAAAAFISMMNVKLVKILWLIAIMIMLIIFGSLQLFVGITRDNLLYFIPISIAGGGIIALVVYLICYAAAKGKFRSIADCDPASDVPITFVICKYGFAACESSTYNGHNLIPWRCVDYFTETDKMFLFYKDGSIMTYIPKKAFDKKYIGGIADIIALMLEQR